MGMVEIEKDLSAGQQLAPALLLGGRALQRPAGVVRRLARRAQQIRLGDHLKLRVERAQLGDVLRL